MEGIVTTFRKKIGPLEVWMWAAIVVAGILAYMYFTKSGLFSTSSNAGDAVQPTSGGNPATSTDTSAGGGGGGLADGLAAPVVPAISGQTPDSASFTPSSYANSSPSYDLSAPSGSQASPAPNYAPSYAQVQPGSADAQSIVAGFGGIPIIGPILTNVLRGPSPSDPIAANPNNSVPGRAPAGSSRF